MAPKNPPIAAAPYSKDERVLCFHMDMLYEAKILDVRPTDEENSWQYKIHYKGWKNTVCLDSARQMRLTNVFPVSDFFVWFLPKSTI